MIRKSDFRDNRIQFSQKYEVAELPGRQVDGQAVHSLKGVTTQSLLQRSTQGRMASGRAESEHLKKQIIKKKCFLIRKLKNAITLSLSTAGKQLPCSWQHTHISAETWLFVCPPAHTGWGIPFFFKLHFHVSKPLCWKEISDLHTPLGF